MKVITTEDRDELIVEFIADYATTHGYAPSIREIGTAVGLTSTSSVHQRLRRLEKAGLVRRASNRARSIVVVPVLAAA